MPWQLTQHAACRSRSQPLSFSLRMIGPRCRAWCWPAQQISKQSSANQTCSISDCRPLCLLWLMSRMVRHLPFRVLFHMSSRVPYQFPARFVACDQMACTQDHRIAAPRTAVSLLSNEALLILVNCNIKPVSDSPVHHMHEPGAETSFAAFCLQAERTASIRRLSSQQTPLQM